MAFDAVSVLIRPARNASHCSNRCNPRRRYDNQSDALHCQQQVMYSFAAHIPLCSQSNLRELECSGLHPLRTAERFILTCRKSHSTQQVIKKVSVGNGCATVIARCSRQPFQRLRSKVEAYTSEVAGQVQSVWFVVRSKSVHTLDL